MAAAAFTWVVLGVLVASVAKLVAWDETPLGWLPVLLAGAGGGALGGYLRTVLWASSEVPGFDPAALMFAIGGAALVVWAYYIAFGRAKLNAAAAATQRRAA